MEMIFRDRRQAGRALGRALGYYAGRSDVIVLALPRGGVPVGFEVARAVRAPLDVFLVRPLVISARGDVGRLGGATTAMVRGTLGFMVRRFEGYAGYELRGVGRVRMHGPVFGVRAWF